MKAPPPDDQEILEIVDAADVVIGTALRSEIHKNQFLHRAVHIFVFDLAGNIFVQRRSPAKDRHPLKLDSSASGHVDPGESYETAAMRELGEELGIQAILAKVFRVTASSQTDYEHVVLFSASTGEQPDPNPEEIQWGDFMHPDRLLSLMRETPWDFVPVFIMLWERFLAGENI